MIKDFFKKNYFAVIMIVVIFIEQAIIYWLSKLINSNLYQYDLSIKGIDENIPLIKWFILPYVLCYPWWYLGLFVSLKYNRPKFYRYICVSIIGYFIAGLLFVLLPTTINRPVVEANDILSFIIKFIYDADTPTNLFPSLHCFISWNCYVSIRGDKNVPIWYRLGYLVMAVLVCLSTVFIRQHFVVDIFAGIILVEIINIIIEKTKIHHKFINYEIKILKERDYDNRSI